MADNEAVRSRRKRLHASGDHSECSSRCRERRLRLAPPVLAPPVPDGELDPVAEMRNLAARLAAAHRADPGNAQLARELRMTLLAARDGEPDPEIDELAEYLSVPEWRAPEF